MGSPSVNSSGGASSTVNRSRSPQNRSRDLSRSPHRSARNKRLQQHYSPLEQYRNDCAKKDFEAQYRAQFAAEHAFELLSDATSGGGEDGDDGECISEFAVSPRHSYVYDEGMGLSHKAARVCPFFRGFCILLSVTEI